MEERIQTTNGIRNWKLLEFLFCFLKFILFWYQPICQVYQSHRFGCGFTFVDYLVDSCYVFTIFSFCYLFELFRITNINIDRHNILWNWKQKTEKYSTLTINGWKKEPPSLQSYHVPGNYYMCDTVKCIVVLCFENKYLWNVQNETFF